MLQKSKSKRVWQLKYLLLVPTLIGIMVYTSCETEANSGNKIFELKEMPEEVNVKGNLSEKIEMLEEMVIVGYSDDPSSIKFIPEELVVEVPMPLTKGEVLFSSIEKAPVFPGCAGVEDSRTCFSNKIRKHIGKNFRYPEKAQEKGIQGRVNVMFTIQEDGNVGNVRMRGPNKLLEDEVARIISLLPQMTAGENKGEKVRVTYTLPITFKLQ